MAGTPRQKLQKHRKITQEIASMSWPRGSILAALLTFTIPLASADIITVNTTTDETAGSLCSLREAAEYFNRDKPKAGWQGCVAPVSSVGGTDTISIPGNVAPYLIKNTAIRVQRSVEISGVTASADTLAVTPTTSTGVVINVVGAHRAFVINNVSSYQSPVQTNPSTATPALDPSDSGIISPNLTTTATPTVQVSLTQVPLPPTGTTMVSFYDVASDGSKTLLGVTISPVSSNWSVTPPTALTVGLHHIVFTTRDATNPDDLGVESGTSPALNLGIAPTISPIIVAFSNMEILGCAGVTAATAASPTDCANNADDSSVQISSNGLSFVNTIANTTGNGGIIYANAPVTFDHVVLHGGHASGKGGVVYGEVVTPGALNTGAGLQFTSSTLRESSAPDGAAVYIGTNSLNFTSTLITANNATAVAGAIVNVARDTSVVAGAPAALIQNTTFGENTGGVALILGNGIVNASTITQNSAGGIAFVNNAPAPATAPAIGIYNTILAGNTGPGVDCSAVPGSVTVTVKYSLLLAGSPCPTDSTNQIVAIPGDLIVPLGDGIACAKHTTGLLCRLADNGGTTLTYKPRVLSSFTSLTDVNNKIINRGSVSLAGNDACPALDQRGDSRVPRTCDIGAVELQAITSILSQGDTIAYGQVYTHSLSDGLGDEELLDPTLTTCPSAPPTVGAFSQYAPTLAGCPWVEMPAGKGTVIFNADGTYTYRPSSDFHGYDRFTVRVITTLSRLNSSVVNQSRLIQVTVLDGPAHGISSDTLGAAGVWELLLLSVTGMIYRRRREV
jgi:CSLREA domain-containing protein